MLEVCCNNTKRRQLWTRKFISKKDIWHILKGKRDITTSKEIYICIVLKKEQHCHIQEKYE